MVHKLLDVVICTHNPRKDFLEQTLFSLKQQTLPREQWRLILVDNASKQPLKHNWDISWHPNSMHILVPELGLTHARMAGIESSKSEIIVFVDDDNVLATDYLENAVKLAANMPHIAAFGGRIIGDYEIPLPSWLQPYLEALAIRDIARSVWSNLYSWDTCPAGAGLILRSVVAKKYLIAARTSSLRKLLDRKGTNLNSAGDVDMAFTAIDMGYGMGRFETLQLKHLISAHRMEKSYILRLTESTAFSQVILDSFREEKFLPRAYPIINFLKQIYRLLFCSYFEYQMGRSKSRGFKKAILFLKKDIIGAA